MRKKISIWDRSNRGSASPTVEKTFETKRMNLPNFKRQEEESEEEIIEEFEDGEHEDIKQGEDILKTLRRNKRGHPKGSPKRRSYNLSVCVSEEEETLLRASAASSEMGFSEWARKAMFHYAKIIPPKR